MDRIQIPEGMGLEEFSIGELGARKGVFRKLLKVSPLMAPITVARKLIPKKKKKKAAPGVPAEEAVEPTMAPEAPAYDEGAPMPGAPSYGPPTPGAPPSYGPPRPGAPPASAYPPDEGPEEGEEGEEGPPPEAGPPPGPPPEEGPPPEPPPGVPKIPGVAPKMLTQNGERLPGVPEKEEEKKGFPVLLVLGGLAVVGIAVYYFYFRKKT